MRRRFFIRDPYNNRIPEQSPIEGERQPITRTYDPRYAPDFKPGILGSEADIAAAGIPTLGTPPPSPIYTVDEYGRVRFARQDNVSDYLQAPSKLVDLGIAQWPSTTEDNTIIAGAMDERGNLWVVKDRQRHNWINADADVAGAGAFADIKPFGAGKSLVITSIIATLNAVNAIATKVPLQIWDGISTDADRLLQWTTYMGPLLAGTSQILALTGLDIASIRPGRGAEIQFGGPGAGNFTSVMMAGYVGIPEIPPLQQF